MSIQKISASELDAASIERLSSRPNEVTHYGEKAMTAKELQAAFDAMGRLNAQKYNALLDAIASGELAEALRFADGGALIARLESTENAQRAGEEFLSPVTRKLIALNTGLFFQNQITAYYTGGRILIRQGGRVEKNKPVVFKLASFPVTAGQSYYVNTVEAIPAAFPGGSTHITDGGRLRVTLDYGNTGVEDTVFKLTNEDTASRAVKYTNETIAFTAERDGTASIQLSIYNNNDDLEMPWYTQDFYVTPRVYEGAPIPEVKTPTLFLLALDEDYKIRWFRHTNRTGTGLSATYSMAEIDRRIDELKSAIRALGGNV